MEKEFCTYEQALAIKELGFDEPCLAHYIKHTSTMNKDKISLQIGHLDYDDLYKEYELKNVPLKQQAFRWFREKYGIKFHIREDIWNNWCYLNILSGEEYVIMGEYKSYEEVEDACIDKLIELTKK